MTKTVQILMFIPRGVKKYLELPGGAAVLGLVLLFVFIGGLFYPPPAILALIAGLIAMAWVGNDVHFPRRDKG